MNKDKRYSYNEIERQAELMLHRLIQLDDHLYLPIDIDAVIERVLDLNLEYRPLSSNPDEIILAKLTPSLRLIQINEGQLSLFQSNLFLERTVKGHEVGHSVLHIDHGEHEYNYSKKKVIYNDPIEREAHRFSACLLIPKIAVDYLLKRYRLDNWYGFLTIRDKLAVTKQMLKLRLKEMGIFTQNEEGHFIGPTGFDFGTFHYEKSI
jgi:hypothetical protein